MAGVLGSEAQSQKLGEFVKVCSKLYISEPEGEFGNLLEKILAFQTDEHAPNTKRHKYVIKLDPYPSAITKLARWGSNAPGRFRFFLCPLLLTHVYDTYFLGKMKNQK